MTNNNNNFQHLKLSMRSKGLNKWLTNPLIRSSLTKILTYLGSWMMVWWRSCWWPPCWWSCWSAPPWTPGAIHHQSRGCRRDPDCAGCPDWCYTAPGALGGLNMMSVEYWHGAGERGNPCQSNIVTVIWTAAPYSLSLREGETRLTEQNSPGEISRENIFVAIIYSRGILYSTQTCPNDSSGQALAIDIW